MNDDSTFSFIDDLNDSFRTTLSEDQVNNYFNFLQLNEKIIRSLPIIPPIYPQSSFIFP